MTDRSCMYCTQNETLQNLMFHICDLGEYKLYFFKNQCYPGRVILAYKDHARCIDELEGADCQEYFGMVHKVTKVIKDLYAPKQINIGTFGDLAGHIHCHIVPKYEGGKDFGGMFQMNPEPGVYLNDAEYAEAIEKIKAALQG